MNIPIQEARREFLGMSTSLALLPLLGGFIGRAAQAETLAHDDGQNSSGAINRRGKTETMDSYREITNLQHKFFEDLDEHRAEVVAEMFAHGTLDIIVPGRPDLTGTGVPGVTQMLNGMFRPRKPNTFGRHIGSNLIVEMDSSGTSAKCRMYSCLVVITQGQDAYVVGLGRHYDDLKIIDGKWWFTRKHIVGDIVAPPPAWMKS